MIKIHSYKKWANIALVHDPLMEVAKLEQKHFSQKDIIKLLKTNNEGVDLKHPKMQSTETIGMIETMRFQREDHGFCDFALNITLREFYPREGRLRRLYQRIAYAHQMLEYWSMLETHLFKNLEYIYYSKTVWDRLDRLKKKYPTETRKNLLLAIAAYAESVRRSQVHLEEDDLLNEYTSNTDTSDNDDHDHDDDEPPPPPPSPPPRKRALRTPTLSATKRKALEVSSPDKSADPKAP